VTYVNSSFVESTRVVRVERVLLERNSTLVYGKDVETGEIRGLRLDRITRAVVRETA
jgi:predicted DNA-binding transcriptional regulator YafY